MTIRGHCDVLHPRMGYLSWLLLLRYPFGHWYGRRLCVALQSMRPETPVAFFDVDETVIRVKSMFEFLRYWLAVNGDDGSAYRAANSELRSMADSGVHRTHINRAYYGHFAGAAVGDVRRAGARWYAEYRDRPDAFVTAALRAIDEHRRAGAAVVLVSGSFRPVLEPLADDLGADAILCTEPEVGEDGRYTGRVERPMIGDGKARAVADHIAALGIAAGRCAAYADHASDLDMLHVVGRPTVVGDDPVLRDHAAREGWPVLPRTTGPRTPPVPAAEPA